MLKGKRPVALEAVGIPRKGEGGPDMGRADLAKWRSGGIHRQW